jgi:hypothetical protein
MQSHMKWALCHRGTTHTKFAAGGEGFQVLIPQVEISRHGVVFQLGSWAWCLRLHTVKKQPLRNVTQRPDEKLHNLYFFCHTLLE